MNQVTLPPSPNWYLSKILSCASDGTIAWGARHSIVIARRKKDSKALDYSIIQKAHSDRVTTIAFSPRNENGNYQLVSGGDDNIVKIWNLNNLKTELKNCTLDNGLKVVGVDWSQCNSDLVCFVSENGYLVTWNVNFNISQIITLGKLNATCLACCPHNANLVSIGSKSGLIYIVDILGSGNINYKLRGHDAEIVSLAWCPIPFNIFENNDRKDLLLASGAKDRNIFLWKAGNDGRYETQIKLPNAPLDSNSRIKHCSSTSTNYTTICWIEPTILLTNSPWGELLLWTLVQNVKKKISPKLIHSKHGKGLFSIAGVVNQNISDKENEQSSKNFNIKSIWTIAQDRQVICCNILDNESLIEYTIPTQGGFVYSITPCPVDTSQIAFGVGDTMIRLWNLSEQHENVLDIQVLWEKIKGQVRALSWHPEKENVLAFATNEGRVGMFDINSKKPPILFRQYHRHIIYSIQWGPAPNIKNYVLYTCGDGELVYYNPDKFNNYPLPVTTKKECTEFCWKSDYSLLALGFGDGSIILLDQDLKEYGHTIHTLNKAVQCLTWHPQSTSSDLSISGMQNYLAVSVNDTTITVFDINLVSEKKSCSNETFYHKIVATLNGHSDKVVCLCWSPHISGYLVSGSYDCTAQVWKVESQEAIATYILHLEPVQCCLWSPLSQDLIITGSADFTLRIWSISDQKVLSESNATMTSIRGKRTKKKKTKELNTTSRSNESKNEKEIISGMFNLSIESKTSTSNQGQQCTFKITKKKKSRRTTHFPGYAELANDNKLWCSSVRNLLHVSQNDNLDKEIPILLGNKNNLENALNYEKNILSSNGQYNTATEIDHWSGNLEQNLQEAMKQIRLNDFLVSLASSISVEFWEKMCEAYANQLILEENQHKAVSYLLCINKVHEAIDLLLTSKLYKEAYVLASSKLDYENPVLKNILIKWSSNAEKDGNFQNATECHIKLGNYEKAAKMLERRKDIDSLILAIELAEAGNDVVLSTSLADKAILEALLNSDITVAKSIIKKHSYVQYRELEIEIFNEINRIFENVNDEAIIDWMNGSSQISLLDTFTDSFKTPFKNYLLLLQKDISPMPVSEKMIQINVSHQVALFILCNDREHRLKHIIMACDIILQLDKTDKNIGNKFQLLMKYLYAFDNKFLSNSSSIFNSNKNGITKSLRAYLCHGVINWFLETKLKEDLICECINLILKILETCVDDLLSKESVKYWTLTNEMNKLEIQLSSEIGKFQNSICNKAEIEIMTQRMNDLKINKKEFLENHINSPNPLLSYGAIMEFISKISNIKIREKATAVVIDTWQQAIK